MSLKKKQALKLTLLFIVWLGVLVCASIASFEFNILPYHGTWGSDAQYYYQAAVSGEKCSSYLAYGYVCLSSWFYSIFNAPVLFYSIVCTIYLLVAFLCLRREADLPYTFATLIFFNPLVIWMFLRGVKEGVFVILLLLSTWGYDNLYRGKFFRSSFFLVAIVLAINTIKSEGVAFAVLAAILTEYIYRGKHKLRRLLAVFICGLLLISVLNAVGNWFPEVPLLKMLFAHRELFFEKEMGGTVSAGNSLIDFIKFVLGPGPATPLVSLVVKTSFYEPTYIGNLLIFFGSAIWWFMIALFMIGLLVVNFKKSTKANIENALTRGKIFMVAISLVYAFTYVFLYGGTGDTRHRAVFYIFSMPIIALLAKVGFYSLVLNPPKHSL